MLWIKDVQCYADSMTEGQRQCNKRKMSLFSALDILVKSCRF